MTYQFRQRQPFGSYSAFDPAGEFLTADFDRYWQGEVGGNNFDRYVQWLQQSLNKIVKPRVPLVEDGDFGTNTRGALWTLRQRVGLKHTGDIVCRDTENKLIAAGAGPPPGIAAARAAETTPAGLTLYVDIPLQVRLGSAKSMTGIFVPQNYCPRSQVDLIVYLHGFKVRSHLPAFSVDSYWSLPRFRLREEVNKSQRNVILVAPTLGPQSQAGSLVCSGGFARFLDQVMIGLKQFGPYANAQTPSVGNIILAGHSGGGSVMRAIAMGGDASAKRIQECWAFEPSFMGGGKTWKDWARPRPSVKVYIYYIGGTAGESLCQNIKGGRMPSSGRVNCAANILAEKTSAAHDDVPATHLKDRIQGAQFLVGTSTCPGKPTREFEFWDREGETGSALDVLSSSELKAVKITSTFETGRPGGFGGLTGNFDGQGLSFGLLNFTIKAGSLIPLLQEFINKHPGRYSTTFEKDADRFKEIIFATKPDPKSPRNRVRDVERQMAFVNEQMNAVPRKAKGNRIVEPWKTYFGRLENDPEFQKIQVKAVRGALDRARYWSNYFGFKTERGFAFMFDLVSSHGGAWLNAKKFKGQRRALLQKMLAAKKTQVGRDALTELEKMEVIANMIADASLVEWRERVRIRKLWFVRGRGEVHGKVYDIKKDFGITDNPPVFGSSKSSEFDFDWENREDEFEEPEEEEYETIQLSRAAQEFETAMPAAASPKNISIYNTDLNAPYFGGNFNFLYNGGSNEAVVTYHTYLSYTKPFPQDKKDELIENLCKAAAIWDKAAEVQVRDASGNYSNRIRFRFHINPCIRNPKNANKRTQVHPPGSRSVFFIDKDRETVMRDLNIFIGSSRNVLVHELGHVWGLKDEYKDRWISMKLSLGHVGPESPVLNDTMSIMNAGYDRDTGEFRTRYFQHFGRAILSAFWGLKKYMIPVRHNGKVVANTVQGRIALLKRDIAGSPPYTADRLPFNPVFTHIQIAKRA